MNFEASRDVASRVGPAGCRDVSCGVGLAWSGWLGGDRDADSGVSLKGSG